MFTCTKGWRQLPDGAALFKLNSTSEVDITQLVGRVALLGYYLCDGFTMGAAQLREWLLTALDDTDGTMTTAELRDYVQLKGKALGKSAVIESVYRNLTVLERRGDVVRRPGPGRDAHWAAAATQRSAQDRPA